MNAHAKPEWIDNLFSEYYDILIIRGNEYVHYDPILRNHVEDCVIEAFELAWERSDELRLHPTILGWLTKTVYNRLDNHKTKASTKMSKTAMSLDATKTAEVADPLAQLRLEEWYEREASREFLSKLLSLLTKTEQEIFDEYFVKHNHMKDIQSRKRMSLAAVKATIRRIRKKAEHASDKKLFVIIPFVGILLTLTQIVK